MQKKGQALYLLLAVVAAALLLSGCGGTKGRGAAPSGTKEELAGSITVVGSTAMQPLVEQAAQQFMQKHPRARIVVQGGGSGTGLSQVAAGAAHIGNSDIFAEEKQGIDASQLTDHKVCAQGFALIVHPAVNVDGLSRQQIKDIFTGKVTNWKEVGGPDQKIVIIHRPKGSGTRATFVKYVMEGVEDRAQGMEQDSSGAVRKVVSETPGAISYLALPYVDKNVKALKIDSAEPTVENIATGKYPFWSYAHMYTKGQPQGLAKAFIDYMLSGEVQEQIVPKMGYIPITKMKIERDARGNITQK
ncbi:phosphate ABC transporter substrate-binding protein [Desulfovirgula thermocuniculi]|uniref:phosphate ABC transporter substrate-binding protein n=1 Tax=Desulfovirgula thermocuniculi TaxID=348842 RepID=UPI00041D1373|nr:phosphate ABC transporter substrate-binding protein [Desulfovirgula thermocuniculi]